MVKRDNKDGKSIKIDLGLGGLLKGAGDIIGLLNQMEKENKSEIVRTGEMKFGKSRGIRGVYGVSIRTGLGKEPKVETFGNIRESKRGHIIVDVREPLIDVFDEGDDIIIIAEMPGIDEKDVKIDVKGDILTISAETGDRKYNREVLLPAMVSESGIESTYKRGVLELRLKKTKKNP